MAKKKSKKVWASYGNQALAAYVKAKAHARSEPEMAIIRARNLLAGC